MPEVVVIGIVGAAGRMGRELLRLGPAFAGLKIGYAWDVSATGERVEGHTVAPLPDRLPGDVRLLIDFSAAPALPGTLARARAARAAYLCGITGLGEDVLARLREAAREIPVLWSPNMSVAMNLLFALAADAARRLPDYRREILEVHHTQKKDAPSGTALGLAAAIRAATGADTPITALRLGDVVGEHTLILGGPGERLELTHRADTRAVFANGALRAAQWLAAQEPGYYTMQQMLGL